jgi:Concanavalin A-like lectin/glucanases superfamily
MKKSFTHAFESIVFIALITAAALWHVVAADAITTDCSSNLSTPNATYTLSANTSNTCNITASGITLNGGGTMSGHAAQAFPNNDLTSGWYNMSGNVLLLHLDEASGAAIDSSGHSTNGSVQGSVSQGVSGHIGSGVTFNGGYLQVSDANIPKGGSARSVSLWFKDPSVSGYQGLFGQGPSGDSNSLYAIIINGNICIGYWGGGDTCAAGLQANTWYHLAITYDGTNGYIYLNGSLVATASHRNYNTGSTGYLIIGRDFPGYDAFGGTIDEFAVFNYALSSGQVASIYNGQTASASLTGAHSAAAVNGNGNNLSLALISISGTTSSFGATITISDSTVATVDVSGADESGNGQNGGTINLTNTAAGALIANGGNSTNNGVGGSAGTFNVDANSTYTSETAIRGSCGPNSTDPSCFNVFTGNDGCDWDDTANWSLGYVPGSGDNVKITANVCQESNNDASVHNATFSNGAGWDVWWWNLPLTVSGTATFSDTSYFNYGNLYGNAIFNDDSYANAGYINGNATFNNNSHSDAYDITGDVDVHNSAYLDNGSIEGNATLYDTTYLNCAWVNSNITFNGSSYPGNCSENSNGSVTFNTNAFSASGAPTGGKLVIDGTGVINFWGQNYSNLYGSDNQPITSFEFDNGSYNYGTVSVSGTTTFNSGSINEFDVTGDAIFNGGSLNESEVDGTATFNDTSSNQNGSLYGNATFNGDSAYYYPGYANNPLTQYYSSSVATTHNFTEADSGGQSWIIVADNATVDLTGATCDPSTVYNAINGGSFVFGGNCPGGPPGIQIIRPVAQSVITSSWSPFVNWNNGAGGYSYTGCQYAYGTSTDWNPSTSDWNNGSPEAGTWLGASCNGNGSDILTPSSRGNEFMAVRANFNGSVATSSTVQFTYAPSRAMYFYNSHGNGEWNSASNWYLDSTHTTPAGDVPYGADKVTIVGTTTPLVNVDTWTQPAIINAGSVGVNMISSATTSVSVPINGRVSFFGSAVYTGTDNGNAVFNSTSANQGTIRLNATFNDQSANGASGHVSGNATFVGDSSSNAGSITGVKSRYYTTNTTTTKSFGGWTVVADGAVVDVSGATHDATTIFRTLNGGSFIGGPTTVYWWTSGTTNAWSAVGNWYSTYGSTTPLGRLPYATETVVTLGTIGPVANLATSTWVTPTGIDATLTGIAFTASSTKHLDTGITGTTTLSGAVINDGIISGNVTINDSSSNSSTGSISGNATFNSTSSNNGGTITGNAVFNNASYNTNGGTITGNATFNDTSYNDTSAGTIGGSSTFNSTSHNDGTIVNDATFMSDITNNNGTVQGVRTRYFTANATTTRDFTTTGPWTLVADGATVDLDTASSFSTTTTFTTLNGGRFVGDGVPGSFAACDKPLMFAGTYTLQGDISATCTIEANGVIINGNGHSIGHTPSALPNNDLNGWVDMTNNVALWHMDENSGSTAALDSSGNNNTMTSEGAVTFGQSGVLSKAVSFDGTGTSVLWKRDTSFTLNPNDQFTISLWIKSNANNTAGSAYFSQDQDNIPNGGFNTAITSYSLNNNTWSDPLGITFETGTNWQTQNNVTSAELPDYNWHLVTGTYNQGNKILYVDGVQVAQTYDSQDLSATPATDTLTSLGTWLCGDNGWQCVGNSNSLVDEVAIWKRVLSPAEVASMYAGQSTGIAISGNGYNFTIQNLTAGGLITSPGATVNVSSSTVGTINVDGQSAAGDGQNGGTVNLTSSTVTNVSANGGSSTDYGYGGSAGTVSGSTAQNVTAHAGANGPNIGNNQEHSPINPGNAPISGCTDPGASNYNSFATIDNGSCRYATYTVTGCTNPGATNYNPFATVNDGSCTYSIYIPPVSSPTTPVTPSNPTPTPVLGGFYNGLVPVNELTGLSIPSIPKFDINLGGIGTSTGIGVSNFGNVLQGLQPIAPLSISGLQTISIAPFISHFLFTPLPNEVSTQFAQSSDLASFASNIGIDTAQDLVSIKKKPLYIGTGSAQGLFAVSSHLGDLPRYFTTTSSTTIAELVRSTPSDGLTITFTPTKSGHITAHYGKESVPVTVKNGVATAHIIANALIPNQKNQTGEFITDGSPLPLLITIQSTPDSIPVPQTPLLVPFLGNQPTSSTDASQTASPTPYESWFSKLFHNAF